MKNWFQLQYTLLIRAIREAGLHPLAALLIVATLAGLFLYGAWERMPYPGLVFSVVGLTLISRAALRPRNDFMRSVFGKKSYYRLRVAEQLVLAIPFILCLILKKSFLCALAFPALSVLLAFVRIDRNRGKAFPTPFVRLPYEVPAGFRKNLIWIIACYGLTAAGILSGNYALIYASLVFLSLIVAGFYSEPDELLYVWNFRKNPRDFMVFKFKSGVICSTALSLPILLSTFFIHPEGVPVCTGIFLAGLALLALMIAGRYSSFPEKITLATGFCMAFSVVFLPLLPVVVFWLFQRSKNRLSALLS